MYPDELYYSEDHEWAKVEDGNLVRMGITHYAQEQLGDIVYVELPEVGGAVVQSDPLGTVESVKTVADIFSPVSGEVVQVNEKLIESPELVNESPYDEGWMVVIKMKDRSEITSLLKREEYEELINKE
jgi:glycine cleavage system H protein